MSRNDSTLWTAWFPMTGPFFRMRPWSVLFANRIRIRPEDDRCCIDIDDPVSLLIDRPAEPVEDR